MRLDDTDRLEAFSDGVLAVIITIMAFGLRTPGGFSWAASRTLLPSLLVYLLSFVMIGIYWNNHHHLLRATEKMDGSVMWSNLAVLFWLSLVPVATSWVARFPHHTLPAAGYGIVALGAGAAYSVLVKCIVAVNGVGSRVEVAVRRDLKGKLSLVLYATGVALAWVNPTVSYALYVAVAVMWFIPDRRLASATTETD